MIESFEDVGLPAELVEALAADGIERPTELQQEAMPVLRRGHNLILRAGPGAGTLVAYGAPLLERIDPGAAGLRALVLVPSPAAAGELAESLARLAIGTGHAVAALGAPWAAAEGARVLFAAPDAALEAVRASRLKLDDLQALVINGAAAIRAAGEWPALETLAALVPHEAQRILVSLPLDAAVQEFAGRHLHKATRVPAAPAVSEAAERGAPTGRLHYLVVEGSKDEDACAVVARALADGTQHVLLFCRSDDRAADAGDLLALHGFASGAPGDAASPVWLGSDAPPGNPPAIGTPADRIATLSYDVPPDPRTLVSRHGGGGPATVLVLPRELAHLRDIAGRARFEALATPGALPTQLGAELAAFRQRLRRAIRDEDLGAQLLLLEPLLQEHSAAEIAAAAVSLLRRKADTTAPAALPAAEAAKPAGAPARPPAWTRLFLTAGQRDGIGPGDLLGAVTGETGIDGSLVGKIEIRDTFSRIEVASDVAETVIRALNGTSIRGRSVRVDYDRAFPGRERTRRQRPPRAETRNKPGDS